MKDNSINTMTAEELEYIKSRYNPYSKQLKDPNVYKKTLKTSLLGSFGAVMTTGGPNAYGTRGEVTSGSWVNPPSFGDYKWSEQSLLSRIESSEKQVNMYKDKLILAEAHLKLLLDGVNAIPVKHNRKKLNIIKQL